MSDNGSVATIVRFPPAVSEVIASMCASATSRTFTHGSRRAGTIGSEQTGTWYIGGNGEIGGAPGTGKPPVPIDQAAGSRPHGWYDYVSFTTDSRDSSEVSTPCL